jgi:hypothetical protein
MSCCNCGSDAPDGQQYCYWCHPGTGYTGPVTEPWLENRSREERENPEDAVAVTQEWSADRWHDEWRKSEDSRQEIWRELHELKTLLAEYLARPSTDGHPCRQEMRRELAKRC